jgi:precorrin-6Y C5,15-methyltransferase (decarboxylating)
MEAAMKRIAIVGVGTGYGTVTGEGMKAIENADALIGGKLSADLFARLGKKVHYEWRADETKAIIDSEMAENIAVLVSGDVGFYSGAELLVKALIDYDVTLIPGISTVQAFFAKIKLPWKNAALISMHGGGQNIVDTVRRNELTFSLTSQNKAEIGERLTGFGFGSVKVYVGENLGSESERVFETTAGKIGEETTKENRTVLVFENPDFNGQVRPGIADGDFFRGETPMTKAEIRAIVMGKLGVSPDSVCADIGAGTGSVTVEMAFAAYKGKVYAIEKEQSACRLIEQNTRKFQVGNVEVLESEATEAIRILPKLDAAFIGGSGGKLSGIIGLLLKNNPEVRIVLTAITLKTVTAALGLLPNAECVQVGVSRLQKGMLVANNPIFVVNGGGVSRADIV